MLSADKGVACYCVLARQQQLVIKVRAYHYSVAADVPAWQEHVQYGATSLREAGVIGSITGKVGWDLPRIYRLNHSDCQIFVIRITRHLWCDSCDVRHADVRLQLADSCAGLMVECV